MQSLSMKLNLTKQWDDSGSKMTNGLIWSVVKREQNKKINKKTYILQKMIAVEACGISSNALLMALPSPRRVQATLLRYFCLWRRCFLLRYLTRFTKNKINVKDTQTTIKCLCFSRRLCADIQVWHEHNPCITFITDSWTASVVTCCQ